MKTLIKVIAVMLLAFLASCANRPDRTPDKQETAAVVNVAGKAVGTIPVFTIGVVTWPFGVVLAFQPEQDATSRLAYVGWPFTWTYIYWTDALPQ